MTLVNDAYAEAALEDRCAPRIKLDIPCLLRSSGANAFSSTIIDLSLGGFSAKAVTGMRTGALCWLSVGPCKGLQAEVIWNDGTAIGCAFANLLNPAVFEAIVNGR
jgi:hypothetical protein